AMVAFLYRLTHGGAHAPACTASTAVRFSDVPTDNVFCGAIAWAADAGVAQGYPDGTFRPVHAVTRGSAAAFLHRIAVPGLTGPTCTAPPFTDVPVDATFCSAIDWAADTGIAHGYDDGTYRPAAPVSRQAMATFLRCTVQDTDAAPGIS